MIAFRSMASEMAWRRRWSFTGSLGELEDPALGLHRGHVEDLDAAAALERLDEIGGDAIDHVDLARRGAPAARVDSSGMKRKVTFWTLGTPGFQ